MRRPVVHVLRSSGTAGSFVRVKPPRRSGAYAMRSQSFRPRAICSRTTRRIGLLIVSEASPRDILIAGHYPHLPRVLALLTGAAAPRSQHGIVALETETREELDERWRSPTLAPVPSPQYFCCSTVIVRGATSFTVSGDPAGSVTSLRSPS